MMTRKLVLVAGLLSVSAAFTVLNWRWERQDGFATLCVDERDLALGAVSAQAGLAVPLTLINHGKTAVRIIAFASSCSCSSVVPSSVTVRAGERTTIRVTIDTRRYLADGSTNSTPFAVEIRALCESAPPSRIWRITGRVESSFRISREFVVFRATQGLPAAEGDSHRIAVSTEAPMSSFMATSSSPEFRTSVTSLGNRYLIHVSPNRRMPPGLYEVPTKLTAVFNGNQASARELILRAEVRPELELTPRIVSFPPARLGSECTATVTASCYNGEELRFVGAEPPDGCRITASRAGTTLTLLVNRTVSVLGPSMKPIDVQFATRSGRPLSAQLIVATYGMESLIHRSDSRIGTRD